MQIEKNSNELHQVTQDYIDTWKYPTLTDLLPVAISTQLVLQIWMPLDSVSNHKD